MNKLTDLRRFINRDNNIVQLLIITAVIFLLMSALEPNKFLRYYNFESISFICQRRRKTRPLGGAKPGQYSRHAGKRREGVARAVLACVRGDFRRTVQADWPDFRALL